MQGREMLTRSQARKNNVIVYQKLTPERDQYVRNSVIPIPIDLYICMCSLFLNHILDNDTD